MKKGLFITLEGPDGSGKTTQAKRLKAYLETKGREVVLTREPGGTGLAETLRSLALSPEITMSKRVESLLHVAARADHVDKVIRPALEAGKVVICDRFSDSTLIYQGILGGMDLDELERLSLFGSKGLSPDVTFLIDGDPRVLLSRREVRGVTDKFEAQGLLFQEKIRQGYLTLLDRYPERMILIDGEGTPDSVTDALIKKVEKFL
ncbi:dTMP kinase [Acidaminococcus intestini]|jgi:dTMP kinase|uniref:dTMP kinase n=1 Tax=Acidaminococcus intestini TaxID=187327 RepID=UPI0022DF216A|nr:dTMP kinase [Acidaminococcus intestini]